MVQRSFAGTRPACPTRPRRAPRPGRTGRRRRRRTPPVATRPASDRRSILRRWPKPARTSSKSLAGATTPGSTAGAGRRTDPDQGRRHVGPGHEHGGRHLTDHVGLGPVGDLDRDGTVGVEPGTGRQALAHLPLHHHQHAADGRHAVEQVGDQRGGDVVRQVGDEHPTGLAAQHATASPAAARRPRPPSRRPARPLPAGPAARWRSTSTAVTDAPVSARARVSEPSPAPISTTRSPGPTSASRAMRRTVLGSATKFWPRARLGRRP